MFERFPEVLHQWYPVFFPTRDGIQFILQSGGEIVVDVLGEMFSQELADDASDIGRVEALFLQGDVLTCLQGRDNCGIGGGSANAMLLQGLDQTGFREARWWFGKMLVGTDIMQIAAVALLQRRQQLFIAGRLLVVRIFLVDRDETRVDHRRAGGTKYIALAAGEINTYRVDGGVDHLAGDSAFPDQVIKLELFGAQVLLDFIRRIAG